MKKVLLMIVCMIAAGTTTWGVDRDLLTSEPDRITDEAIARDTGTVAALQARLARLNSKGTPIAAYHFAKAQAWLDFAMDEYARNDRSRVTEEALQQAHSIISQLESGKPDIPVATPIIPTSTKVRADLWERAETMKKMANFRCAGERIAQLEVQLVWAGHQEREFGWRHAKPYLQAAERLAGEAEQQLTTCPPLPATNAEQPSAPAVVAGLPSAAMTLPSPAAPAPAMTLSPPAAVAVQQQPAAPAPCPDCVKCNGTATAAAITTAEPLPESIHFAYDRADLSATSAAILNRVIAAMKSSPHLTILLQGHADQRGSDAYNMELSGRRMENVRSYLLQAGISAERMGSTAFGKSRPLVDEPGSEAYARNRRVTFVFTMAGPQPTVPQMDDLQPELATHR